MGVDMARIDLQGGFKVAARLLKFAHGKQEIGEVDMPTRIVRMMADGGTEQRARGRLISGVENERAEIVERAEIGGYAP